MVSFVGIYSFGGMFHHGFIDEFPLYIQWSVIFKAWLHPMISRYRGFHKWRYPKIDAWEWTIHLEIDQIDDDMGVPPFQETSIYVPSDSHGTSLVAEIPLRWLRTAWGNWWMAFTSLHREGRPWSNHARTVEKRERKQYLYSSEKAKNNKLQ